MADHPLPTVFLDVKGVGDFLCSVRRGGDHVGSFYCLRNYGMGQVEDAALDALVQPLGDAVGVWVLHADRRLFRAGV